MQLLATMVVTKMVITAEDRDQQALVKAFSLLYPCKGASTARPIWCLLVMRTNSNCNMASLPSKKWPDHQLKGALSKWLTRSQRIITRTTEGTIQQLREQPIKARVISNPLSMKTTCRRLWGIWLIKLSNWAKSTTWKTKSRWYRKKSVSLSSTYWPSRRSKTACSFHQIDTKTHHLKRNNNNRWFLNSTKDKRSDNSSPLAKPAALSTVIKRSSKRELEWCEDSTAMSILPPVKVTSLRNR